MSHGARKAERQERTYLVIYGDWGGSFNLVAPVKLVRCSDIVLNSLAKEIGRLDDGTEDAMFIDYVDIIPGEWIEIYSDGKPVPDNVDWVYNRFRATDRVFISQGLRDLDVLENILDILAGRSKDVKHLFKPNLRGIVAQAKSGKCSQERFEQIVVQILRATGSWAERFSRVRENGEPYPDVHSSSSLYEDESVTLEVNCAVESASINGKLKHLAIVGKSGDLSFRENPGIVHKRALFSTVSANEIARVDLKFAVKHRIALVPIEGLEEIVRWVTNGFSLLDLAGRLAPGISEMHKPRSSGSSSTRTPPS